MTRVLLHRLPPLACVAVPLVLLISDWGPLTAAHPAHIAVLAAVLVLGGVAAARKKPLSLWLTTPLTVVLLVPLVYLRPFAATAVPTLDERVRVVDTATTVVLRPEEPIRAGFVFHPGARVDHRAYLPLLHRVAARGFLVVVVKAPLGMALLSGDAARTVLAEHPAVPVWAVGGHSLGGVVAARDAFADSRIRGLVLWASYPVDDLSGRIGLSTWSISAEHDALSTPREITASAALLPPGTRFEVIPGAVHSFFADYGAQPGDGVPTVPRARAQTDIVEKTVAALAAVT
ncbi:alpha/beta hydrolase [Allokutzneria albata]|uniref:Alpha/beta hydrolase family protein n=1 Tax=Allokutzneria albata TaxID=211114 RepID=A0A1G9SIT8_ALLAB|nr:alpha/beta hydrolase [Allokutzneria albata]SDM34695.1 Alpha/beta hydrolase family protein [Allokutzneria albata]